MDLSTPSSSPVSSGSTTTTTSTISTTSADRKVLADLEILLERMRRCDELLLIHDGHHQTTVDDVAAADGAVATRVIPTTPALLSVVGFLEASAPRMVELVEVAAQGAVSEVVLMKCLDVNDRLTKLLEEIDSIQFVESTGNSSSSSSDAIATTTNESDTLPPAIGTTKSEDEFDAFLNDRVQNTTVTNNNVNDNDGGLL